MNNTTTKIEEFFREIERVVITPLHLYAPRLNELDIQDLREFFTTFGPWEEFKKLIQKEQEEADANWKLKAEIDEKEDQIDDMRRDIDNIADDLECMEVDDQQEFERLLTKLRNL